MSWKVIYCMLWIFACVSIGCNDGNTDTQDQTQIQSAPNPKTNKKKIPVKEPDPTTQEMIAKYEEIVSQLDPAMIDDYFSSKKLLTLDDKIDKAVGNEKTGLIIEKAMALLNVGKIDDCVLIIKSVLNDIPKSQNVEIKKYIYSLNKLLAIAYMRKAEIENCIANHNEDSCIIPISKKARHKRKKGAKNTILVLEKLLKENPEDKESQYLLNIAHMTLGTYPDKVPAEYRIPQSYFANEAVFPKFKDIGSNLGVGVNQLSGGTCIDDFNNDGYLDIIASSWGFDHQIKYFENDKNGGFVDMTNATGLMGVHGGLNLRHADFNNDGNLDFIILRGAWFESQGNIPNSLIRNNGDGTFTDVTLESGIYSLHPTQTAVWADFNLDGWVDLFIANESSPELINQCELYVNNGDGIFTNQISTAGLNRVAYYKGVAVGDVNNDRLPDLYLSNLYGSNILLINKSKDGVVIFDDSNNDPSLSKPTISFSTWMFDYNNDGRDDIFVSGYSGPNASPAELMMDYTKDGKNENRPYLFKNQGSGRFVDVAKRMKIDEPATTMGCNFGDLNNDGFLDFYLSTGNPDYYSIVPNKMYLNNGGKSFQDVTYSSGFGHIQKGHAVGFGDFDFDGDQDIYTVMGGAYEGDVFSNLLFENPVGNENNWINIKLVGVKSNAAAIGAKIKLTISENGKERSIYHNVGYDASFGGNSLLAEIGIGKAQSIKKLEVFWPNMDKTTTIMADVAINQNIIIEEGKSQYILAEVNRQKFKEMSHQH